MRKTEQINKWIAVILCVIMTLSLFAPMNILKAEASEIAQISDTSSKMKMEYLDRGLVAILTDEGVFLSWRYLVSDSEDICFNIYKNGKLVNQDVALDKTNYVDTTGSDSSQYQISTIVDGVETMDSKVVSVWHNKYKSIPLNKPVGGRAKDGVEYEYYAGDATAADLDGDGEYEIIFLWSPTNAHDNSQSGFTGNVYVEAVKLDGTSLWRLDLGVNIRAGAHYTQLMAYDLDVDGKAEIVLKTADGTIDGQGIVIGNPKADYRNASGYILEGPEYLTIFDGQTGAAISTVDYVPLRGDVGSWGDTYGNRVDRFLACIAYLDGIKPSVVMCRGYYTRSVLAAFDYNNGTLEQRWVFDSNVYGKKYEGQGNHGLSVLDIDDDGKQEIIYGALVIDDDGTPLYCTGLGHGDAMHAGRLDPTKDGYQIFSVHEDKQAQYGLEMRDARTGEITWGVPMGMDVGRGISADIDPTSIGYESWSTTIVNGAIDPVSGVYAPDGTGLYSKGNAPKTANFAIWWDGDLLRELLDHQWDAATETGVPVIYKWDYKNKKLNTILKADGALSNNSTKGNPTLQADILGDWREEVIVRSEDSSELRLYSTTIPTEYRIPTLMQDPVYRMGIAWQNVSYNQPPHVSFYLGNETTEFPKADVDIMENSNKPEEVCDFAFGENNTSGQLIVKNTEYTEENGYGFIDDPELIVNDSSVAMASGSTFVVDLDNGNYRVELTLGNENKDSLVSVKSEYIQKISNVKIEEAETYGYSYDVALVDGQLEFVFTGENPSIRELKIYKHEDKTIGLKPTLYMAGDSTMQTFSQKQAPQEGWGQQFKNFFTNDVIIQNDAIGGRSSKSFLVDGRLDNILNQIKPEDYLLISFGHNDASVGVPERYTSPEDYQMYLERYVEGARQRGAIPILLTPVGRRDFNSITREFNVSFPEYVNAMIETAEELDVYMVDLSTLSVSYYNEIGLAATEDLFLFINPGQYPYFPNGASDSTHFKTLGAKKIAGIVANALAEMELTISEYVIDPDKEEPEPPTKEQYFYEDFENDSADTYVVMKAAGIGGEMSSAIVTQSGNRVLQLKGSGTGHRAAKLNLFDAVGGDIVELNFAWNPGSPAAWPCEGHLTIQDANENMILTLYAASGNTNSVGYYVGGYTADYSTSSDGNSAIPNGIFTQLNKNQWLDVKLKINFVNKTMDLTLTSKDNPNNTQTISDIPMSAGTEYVNNIKSIRFLGTRKGGGGSLDWTTSVDNVKIQGSKLEPEEPAIIEVESIQINSPSLTSLKKGSTLQLETTINPTAATDKTIKWTSSNSQVASVDPNGKVTAYKTGIISIKAESLNGKSFVILLNVN